MFTMSVARRNMVAGKGRTALSIAGVAVATLLLLFVLGLYRGWNDGIVRYVRETKTDVWVVGKGADSFFTPSIVFNTTVVGVSQTPGIERTDTILGRPMTLRRSSGGAGQQAYVIGFDSKGAGGPVEIAEGSGTPGDREIVIDEVLAKTTGWGVGDELQAGLRRLKVVGISRGGNLVLAQLAFVNKEEAHILLGIDAIVNFVLLQTAPGQTASVVDAINKSGQGVSAFDSATFGDNSQKVLHRSMLPILLVIVLLAVIVGTIVVGLTVYTAVVEKEREFGVLKALGVTAAGLTRVVFEQSLVCGALGFALGVGLTYLVSWLAGLAIPQVVPVFRLQDMALVLLAAGLMSVVAALLPMQRVIRVDTLSVFKA
jgi:putative ABC transport system permease protein